MGAVYAGYRATAPDLELNRARPYAQLSRGSECRCQKWPAASVAIIRRLRHICSRLGCEEPGFGDSPVSESLHVDAPIAERSCRLPGDENPGTLVEKRRETGTISR